MRSDRHVYTVPARASRARAAGSFLPVMIALRGWSLRKDDAPDVVVEEISEFVVRGLGLA